MLFYHADVGIPDNIIMKIKTNVEKFAFVYPIPLFCCFDVNVALFIGAI